MGHALQVPLLVLLVASACGEPMAMGSFSEHGPSPSSPKSGKHGVTWRVTVAQDGSTTIDGKPISAVDLDRKIRDRRVQEDIEVVLDAEGGTAYRTIARAGEAIKGAGAVRVVLGTAFEPPPASPRPPPVTVAPPASSAPPPPKPPPLASFDGAVTWDCPFPASHERGSVNDATVKLRVLVGADGNPKDVEILGDPGYGYGPAAKRCAMARTIYRAAKLDGQEPVTAWTPPFSIRFLMQ